MCVCFKITTIKHSNLGHRMSMLEGFKILTVTHHEVQLEEVGAFLLPVSDTTTHQQALENLKDTFQLEELLYISTCNRVVYLFYKDTTLDIPFINRFFRTINPSLTEEKIQQSVAVYDGMEAIIHLYEVGASIESMVVGEREIMRQIRESYKQCEEWNLTGDNIRLLMKYLVQAIKEVYAKTRIGDKPVSVVSLAMHLLKERKIPLSARILLIGAGQTNTLVGKFLLKQRFTNIQVFNRSTEKATQLAQMVNGKAHALSTLKDYEGGFDVLIVSTGATQAIIEPPLYQSILQGDEQQKVVVDLSLPNNVSKTTVEQFPIDYINIDGLKELADLNHSYRKQEIGLVKMLLQKQFSEFEKAYKGRQIEIAMRQVPTQIKEIKTKAMSEVFKKDLEELDDNTLALIDKMMTYMEKKCISIPMKVAKKIAEK